MANVTRNGASIGSAQGRQMRDELVRLREENARLREQNRHLRLALDAHITRTASTALFGPVEMSAGTCVGPGRRRRGPKTGS